VGSWGDESDAGSKKRKSHETESVDECPNSICGNCTPRMQSMEQTVLRDIDSRSGFLVTDCKMSLCALDETSPPTFPDENRSVRW
jgi:hypothetical protein